MTKTDLGLKLLSLYRDITKARYNNDSGRLSEDLFEDSDTSTVEGMTAAILLSLDSRDFDKALTLLNDWVMNYPLEKERTSLYNYLRAEYHLRLLDGEEAFTETVNNLNEAIDAANSFFMANKSEGHAMDNVAEELSDRLRSIINSIDKDDINDDGLQILELEEPVALPKNDETPRGLIIRALKRHTDKYGHLNSEAKYLVQCICNEFGIHESIV